MYTSDMPTSLATPFAIYAENTALYRLSKNYALVCRRLQGSLDQLWEYARKWRICPFCHKAKLFPYVHHHRGTQITLVLSGAVAKIGLGHETDSPTTFLYGCVKVLEVRGALAALLCVTD